MEIAEAVIFFLFFSEENRFDQQLSVQFWYDLESSLKSSLHRPKKTFKAQQLWFKILESASAVAVFEFSIGRCTRECEVGCEQSRVSTSTAQTETCKIVHMYLCSCYAR